MTPSRACAALAVTLALGACTRAAGPGAAPSPPAAPVTTPPVVAPTPSALRTVATALPTDLADGRHHARLRAFDRTRSTLTVDVVQFLTGDAAQQAAREDGEEAFDYYVRNQNPKLRTLTFAAGLKVVTNTLTAGESGSSSKDVPISHARLAAFFEKGQAQRRVFWFELSGGAVVRLQEQYLP